jgi:serine/threonine protein kinase
VFEPFGCSYRSFNDLRAQETGQKTAVKVVSKKKLSDEDYASLLMEIEILSQLDHPHIIR